MNMVVKVCVDCDRPIDQCRFQKNLRSFHLDKFADLLTEERVIQWTSSNFSAR